MASSHMMRALSEMAKHGGNYFGQVHGENLKSKRVSEARAEADRVKKEGWGRDDELLEESKAYNAELKEEEWARQDSVVNKANSHQYGILAMQRENKLADRDEARLYAEGELLKLQDHKAEVKETDAVYKQSLEDVKAQAAINKELDATDKKLTATDAQLAADFTSKIAIMEQMEDLLTGPNAINTGPADNLMNEAVAKWVETEHSEKLAIFNTLTSSAVLDKSQALAGSVSNADMSFLTLAGAGVKLTTAANLKIVRFQMGILRNAQENLKSRRAYFNENKNYLAWQPKPYMTPERLAEAKNIMAEGTKGSGKNLGRGGIAAAAAIKKKNAKDMDAMINKYTMQPQ